jgi:hypothetical protein
MHGAEKEHRDKDGKRDGALPEDNGTIFFPNHLSSSVKIVERGIKG